MVTEYNRRSTDGPFYRATIATVIFCTFLILGVLAYAIVNTNQQVETSVQVVEDGIACLLGNVAGHDDIRRPDIQDVQEACSLFLGEVDE